MIVFLDTEFSDFVNFELLSIGLVTIDDREFYAELDLDTEVGHAREMASSDFVRFEGVLDLWRRVHGATCPLNEIGLRLGRWFEVLLDSKPGASSPTLLIAFDHSTDYELTEFSLRDVGLLESLRGRLSPINVFRETASRAGQQAAEACYAASRGDDLGRHNALADARALRASYLAAKGALATRKGTDL